MPRNGQWIRPLRRRAIHLRDDWTCVYCGVRVDTGEARVATLDHVGDRDDHSYKNLVTACHRCNSIRQNTPIETWVPDPNRRRRIHERCRRDMTPFVIRARIDLEIEHRISRRTLVPEEDVERIVWARVQGLVEQGALVWSVDPNEVVPQPYRQSANDVPF
jgi:hypothetical protein